MVFVDEVEADRQGRRRRGRPGRARRARGGHARRRLTSLAFLREILDEARSNRHDMITHYTVDDLRVALGFARARGGRGGERRQRPGVRSRRAPRIRPPDPEVL